MSIKGTYILILFLGLLSCTSQNNESIKKIVPINANWVFQQEGEDQVFLAKVPGSVQYNLMLNNRLPNPFYRNNEKEFQWVDKENWLFSTEFEVDSNLFDANKLFLKFNGLDTYAEIKLNDSLILFANNFYRSWRVDVKDLLLVGRNNLSIKFISPIKIGLNKLEQLGYSLPAVNDQSDLGGIDDKKVSVFTRKPPYHYGWDWGPRFVTMGIWKPVELQIVPVAEINDVYLKQKLVTQEYADLSFSVNFSGYESGTYTVVVKNENTEKTVQKKNLELKESKGHVTIDLHLKNPELWWPNGYGEQSIYTFSVRLLKNARLLDSCNIKTGLRTINLIRDIDKDGQTFYFEVNGVPIFAKGANYIPNDNFLNQVSDEKYEYILESAASSNMNMIRVWGGGIYENDKFYELCDEKGLLVWQDFMFACSMYPGDYEFIENVRQEAIENIKRLRNHPSIALWCGNNEIDAAWYSWGWKEKYTVDQQKDISFAYDTIFLAVLPKLVKELDENSTYWPSSPLADWGRSATYSATSGDMHYWGVWHGDEPFKKFQTIKSRFMSEYGFQSFPEFNTIKEFTIPQDWNLDSEVMLAHQRSPAGNKKIKEYMQMYFPVPDNFKGMLYMGQLLQAYGIKIAIDAHRISKPYTMGTLYWQLNDSWPGASWSGIDYYGKWKALQYTVKDAYKPTALAFEQINDKINLFIVNDNAKLNKADINVKLVSFNGIQHIIYNEAINFSFDSSTSILKLNVKDLEAFGNIQELVLVAKITKDDIVIDSENHYLVLPKDLKLNKCSVNMVLNREDSGQYLLSLTSDKLAKNIQVNFPNTKLYVSENYFDLLPGETKVLKVINENNENITENKIKIRMLNDYMD